MAAVVPTTTPNLRNGSVSCTPHLMEDVAGVYQYGYVVRADLGVTLFRRTINADPLDPASYLTVDASAIAALQGSVLFQNVNGVYGINIEDNHFILGLGVDDLGRVHLMGDTHADPQRYAVSDAAAGIADLTTWNMICNGQSTGGFWSAQPWAGSGGNFHTYVHFNRMSDGRLIVMFDQQENINSRGRDVLGYYLPTGRTIANIKAGGTAAWRPLCDTATGTGTWTGVAGSSRGELVYTAVVGDSPTGIPTTAIGAPPDPGPANRAYLNDVIVEYRPAGDRIHITGVFRTVDADARSSQVPFYAYTDAIGLNTLGSWRNVHGDPITMPINWTDRAQVALTGAPARTFGGSMAITADGRPMIVMDNGATDPGTIHTDTGIADGRCGMFPGSTGATPSWGQYVRAEYVANVWTWTNLGLTNQGHPTDPILGAAGPNAAVYAISTGSAVRLRAYAGNVNVPNGGTPFGTPWRLSVATIAASGTVTIAGGGVALSAETLIVPFDPVALAKHRRWDVLIPDGDRPVVTSFGNHKQISA